jgi:aryl-alcohol dehydrogenase-like predicted oxidoreductase
MAFERRGLGRTGLTVSPFAIGGGYRIGDDGVTWAFEHGINTFFWAPWMPTYRPMERALRQLLPAHRDEIVLMTAAYSWLLPGSLERSVHRHLRRLGTDHIDVFLLGFVLRESQARAFDQLARLKERGLVRAIGFSSHNRPMVRRVAERWPGIDVLMVRYNAAHRGLETDILPHLDGQDGRGLIAFNALKHGAMLRRPSAWPADRPLPSARQCYRFVLSQPRVHLCLAGASGVAQVKELLQAASEGPLTPEELSFMQAFGDARHG